MELIDDLLLPGGLCESGVILKRIVCLLCSIFPDNTNIVGGLIVQQLAKNGRIECSFNGFR